MQETSLVVYYNKVLPNLGAKQAAVLKHFLDTYPQDWTNMEVAGVLGWSINRVTPRVLELRKQGLLELAQTRRCDVTSNNAMAWKVANYSLDTLLEGVDEWHKWRYNLHYHESRLSIVDYIPKKLWIEINERMKQRGFVYDHQKRAWVKA